MNRYLPFIHWIESQQEEMINLLIAWSEINSGTRNLKGLSQMCQTLQNAFSCLQGKSHELELSPTKLIASNGEIIKVPLGKALSVIKRPEAPIQVLLSGHMDTVFPLTSPFQNVERIDDKAIKGPGVADMKGGLVVMLKALEALEKTSFCEMIGWEVLISPDEEIGSLGTASLLEKRAKRNHIGLIFEPAFQDGAIVSSRKGSVNFTLIFRGLEAHAGRNFHQGKNAINALAKVIIKIEQLNKIPGGTAINVGFISGGGPINIVPNFCLCRINIRACSKEELSETKRTLEKIVETESQAEGISAELYQDSFRPPKLFDEKTKQVYNKFKECAEQLGISLKRRPSGGCCDGNNLAAAGLITLDSLGVVGGRLHTHDEYMLVESLAERAKVVALFLMKMATGELGEELYG